MRRFLDIKSDRARGVGQIDAEDFDQEWDIDHLSGRPDPYTAAIDAVSGRPRRRHPTGEKPLFAGTEGQGIHVGTQVIGAPFENVTAGCAAFETPWGGAKVEIEPGAVHFRIGDGDLRARVVPICQDRESDLRSGVTTAVRGGAWSLSAAGIKV
jgi:hypothetical protein